MFFRKTKRDLLQRVDGLKQTFDNAISEFTHAREELVVHSDDYVIRIESQIEKFRNAVVIGTICYLLLLFGMLLTLLFFVI